MTKLLADAGLSEIDLARANDKYMAKYTDHEPLPDDRTPDVLEELEHAWGMHVGMDDGGQGEEP
jgi:hypothetical protein